VTAAAALPIALTGAVGVGLLSEMGKASARMQTSASILGVARDNFFREPGNVFDKHITRPLSEDILSMSQDFDDAMREGRPVEAITGVLSDVFPDNTQTGSLLNLIDTIVSINNTLGEVDMGWIDVVSQSWPGWPDVTGLWPEWPDIQTEWPEWPSIDTEWPGWPSIDTEWPGWPSIGAEWPGWPDIGTPSWPSAGMILNQFPTLSASALRDAILGDGSSGGGSGSSGGGGGGGFLPDFDIPLLDGYASGGRVQRTGAAVVHRNEIIADPDRLVSELASAVSQSTGRRTRSMDTGGLERRLDQLHDDFRRLEGALDVTVQIGEETVARASANGRRNRIADSNPRV